MQCGCLDTRRGNNDTSLYIVAMENRTQQHIVKTSLSKSDRGSSPLAAVSKLGQFRSLHVASIHSAV